MDAIERWMRLSRGWRYFVPVNIVRDRSEVAMMPLERLILVSFTIPTNRSIY